MILALKCQEEATALVDLPKAVFSFWPLLSQGRFARTACNISLCFRNLVVSPLAISSVCLIFRDRTIFRNQVYDISATLLDRRNPLSYSFTGPYEKKPGEPLLLKYDGVTDVRVDSAALYRAESSFGVQELKITFGQCLKPGEIVAIRFLFVSDRVFTSDSFERLHFSHTIFDESLARPLMTDDEIERRAIPALTVCDAKSSGGLDVFFYMPLEFEGESFSVDPLRRLMPEYDYVGNPTEQPFWKHCWPAALLTKTALDEPHYVRVGDRLTIAGTFEPVQKRMPIVNVKNRDGNIIIGGTLINSSVSSINPSGNEVGGGALKYLIELLQRKIEDLAIADDDKDLVLTQANLLAQAEKNEEKFKRLLSNLESLVIDVSRRSPSILSIVEIIYRIRGNLAQ